MHFILGHDTVRVNRRVRSDMRSEFNGVIIFWSWVKFHAMNFLVTWSLKGAMMLWARQDPLVYYNNARRLRLAFPVLNKFDSV